MWPRFAWLACWCSVTSSYLRSECIRRKIPVALRLFISATPVWVIFRPNRTLSRCAFIGLVLLQDLMLLICYAANFEP
jgi:hypothetical protein